MNKALKIRIIEIFGTQSDFAQALGMDESLVSRVIRGRRQLDLVSQRKWAKLLKCKTENIFGNQKVKSG